MRQSMTATLQRLYGSVLAEKMGLQVGIDGAGDLVVELDGASVVVALDGGDPAYLRVLATLDTSPYEGVDDTDVVHTCAHATAEYKGAKVYLAQEGIVVAVELAVAAWGILPTQEHLTAVLPRVIAMLRGAAQGIDERLRFAGIASGNEM